MTEEYKPEPLDTSAVTLTPDQKKLVEALSQNAHDVWAQKRMAEGGSYGLERNDNKKTHPCLVPYDRLPESEKDYDRAMVDAVIRSALKLGYRIEKE